jgi:hypothetical protein
MPNSPVATEFLGQETLLCFYLFYEFFMMISCCFLGVGTRNPCGGITFILGNKNWLVADALHGKLVSLIVDNVPSSK